MQKNRIAIMDANTFRFILSLSGAATQGFVKFELQSTDRSRQ